MRRATGFWNQAMQVAFQYHPRMPERVFESHRNFEPRLQAGLHAIHVPQFVATSSLSPTKYFRLRVRPKG